MGENQWYHFGVGVPPISVYSSEDWDVHWGYGILTHGPLNMAQERLLALSPAPSPGRKVGGAAEVFLEGREGAVHHLALSRGLAAGRLR